MSNIWDGKIVRINAEARVRVWSVEDNEASMFTIPADEADRTYRVVSALACSSMNGGGSNLTLVEDALPDELIDLYHTWVHSSKVTVVA